MNMEYPSADSMSTYTAFYIASTERLSCLILILYIISERIKICTKNVLWKKRIRSVSIPLDILLIFFMKG